MPGSIWYGPAADGLYRYEGAIKATMSGEHALSARILPTNPSMSSPYEVPLIRWA